MKTTPIRISYVTIKLMKTLKIYPRETYDDIIRRLIKFFKETKEIKKVGKGK